MNGEQPSTAFRAVPRTGVIYVTTEASRRGYSGGDPAWCNLGQGQPETGELPGAPARVGSIHIDPADQDYAPVAGLPELRAAVADLYNRLYRRGMRSQYTAENVAISAGGRVALARVAASIGHVNLGHFLPDYTAYEELLEIFRAFTAIPIVLEGERRYAFTTDDLRREVLGKGIGVLLASNPANPTGRHVRGTELEGWVRVARELDCTLLLDEFYSHYVWTPDGAGFPVESAARYVEDVDRDPVVILDGLTKNWRYPGWRIAWTIAPRPVIEAITSAGSFLDGGASKPLQHVAVPLVAEEPTLAETRAIQSTFRPKRDYLLSRLRAMGITVDLDPEGTFYAWGRLSGLPPGLRDGMSFFRAALERQVITVPGQFFDVNPGKRRGAQSSRFRDTVRFSFGPGREVLELACDRLEAMIGEETRA
ncbi:MAG: pyridoxal phosphate-dependent aminotransferase [Deltaproteobacteria bacterium]|nr:pyridoxal phosphate-dependent aminotransferase [Deltaproteobacteria bacterium]